jgi:hypothetical protein
MHAARTVISKEDNPKIPQIDIDDTKRNETHDELEEKSHDEADLIKDERQENTDDKEMVDGKENEKQNIINQPVKSVSYDERTIVYLNAGGIQECNGRQQRFLNDLKNKWTHSFVAVAETHLNAVEQKKLATDMDNLIKLGTETHSLFIMGKKEFITKHGKVKGCRGCALFVPTSWKGVAKNINEMYPEHNLHAIKNIDVQVTVGRR